MCCYFFFFKQKTAYEMRISDWSSDVCSSDLVSSEQDYQDARQVYSEANVLLRTAEQNLVAVGLDPKSAALDGGGRYGVTTPIDGAIIDWNIAQGQMVGAERSEEHTSELQSLMRISYDVFCLKKKNKETSTR